MHRAAPGVASPPTRRTSSSRVAARPSPLRTYSQVNAGTSPPVTLNARAVSVSLARPAAAGPTIPPMRRGNHAPALPAARAADRVSRRTASHPRRVTFTPSPIASDPYTPCDTRIRILSVVPSSCRQGWVDMMNPMFEDYGRFSSDRMAEECADLLHRILDAPGQTLRQSDKVSQINSNMSQYGVMHAQHMHAQRITRSQSTVVVDPTSPSSPWLTRWSIRQSRLSRSPISPSHRASTLISQLSSILRCAWMRSHTHRATVVTVRSTIVRAQFCMPYTSFVRVSPIAYHAQCAHSPMRISVPSLSRP